MSSPLAKNKKNILDKALINFHKKASHSNRIDLLSALFFEEIQNLKDVEEQNNLRCLDIGCGDMSLSEKISEKDSNVDFIGIDIHQVPNELKGQGKWAKYTYFDGKKIPFEDNSFDIAMFSDVLHHDYDNIEVLLNEAKRVSKYILIKDHFEYGFFSRKILQFADIIGNYGYGISIPKKYLSKKSFNKFLSNCGLEEVKRVSPIYLYDHNPIVKMIFKAKYQFISILK